MRVGGGRGGGAGEALARCRERPCAGTWVGEAQQMRGQGALTPKCPDVCPILPQPPLLLMPLQATTCTNCSWTPA